MAKLRFDSKTGSSEWEGTPQELLAIYDGLKQRLGNNIRIEDKIAQGYVTVRPKTIVLPEVTTLPQDNAELATKMPNIDQMIKYILGKPKFEHDIVDVGKYFFGKQLNSRQYEKLYRELRNRLEAARKSIEISQGGAFERRPTSNRNLPSYSFKKINITSLDSSLQKAS